MTEIVFGAILDRIWWRRNEFILCQNWMTSSSVVANIWALLKDIKLGKETQNKLQVGEKSTYDTTGDGGRHMWENYFKLHCDGAFF